VKYIKECLPDIEKILCLERECIYAKQLSCQMDDCSRNFQPERSLDRHDKEIPPTTVVPFLEKLNGVMWVLVYILG